MIVHIPGVPTDEAQWQAMFRNWTETELREALARTEAKIAAGTENYTTAIGCDQLRKILKCFDDVKAGKFL